MAAEPAFERRDQAEVQFRLRERRIAEIGQRQKGVAGRWQLVELGFTRNEIATRLACGRLHEIYRGVYAVGHRGLGRAGWLMAAVLAGGPGALLSHRAAGNHWGVSPFVPGRIDVTLPRWRRPRSNLRFHQAPVPADERTIHEGIPTTTVPRTLLDLSSLLDPHGLERAINQAEVLRLTDGLSLGNLVERYPGRRGLGTLRLVLADRTFGANATRSELEERFLAFVAESGLPQPEVNDSLYVGGRWYEVDCLWRAAGLVVELDGYRAHGTRAAFEHDRARTRALQAAGWRVFPVTWRQLHRNRAGLLSELRLVLAHRQ
jgi:very-short-patch-repair endonuclease